MALKGSAFLSEEVETGLHRLIIGDALVIVAFHDAYQLFRHLDFLLLHHFIVANDAESYVWCNYRKLVDFVIRKELIGNLDDALVTHLLALEVVANCDSRMHVLEMKQTYHFKEFGRRYVVDDCAVLDGRDN